MIGSKEVLEALPVAVYLTDTEGRLTFYNEAAAEFWGCRPELLQQPLVRVMAPLLARRPANGP